MSSVVKEQLVGWGLVGGVLALLASGCTFDKHGNPQWDAGASPSCGNSVIGESELCDDGNSLGGDGCNAACQPEPGWECSGEPSVCTQLCGDGLLLGDEPCDDGNQVGGDGCSEICEVEPGWVCSGVPSDCVQVCGDGITGPGEQCDDGNFNSGDGCAPNCQVEPGYACTGSPSVCTPVCGDGMVGTNEECDDGDNTAGDGCSPNCQLEDFHACHGETSECVCVVYVDQDTVLLTRTGASWQAALTGVQEGIAKAALRAQTAGTCAVWIAAGTYHVYQTSNEDSIILETGVSVYGGFAGVETWISQRNISGNETILDGTQAGNPSLRVRSVVTANGIMNAGLDGLTVANGGIASASGGGFYIYSADVSVHQCRFEGNVGRDGAGIYLQLATGTITNTTVMSNSASEDGGGVHYLDSGGAVQNCVFEQNSATGWGGGAMLVNSAPSISGCTFDANQAIHGGGVFFSGASPAVISDTLLQDNVATSNGGGLFGYLGSDVIVDSCRLLDNVAGLYGGGMRVEHASLVIENSLVAGNEAQYGGGLDNSTSLAITISSCTIADNSALGVGDAGGGLYSITSQLSATNTILWGNTPTQIRDLSGVGGVTYCDVQGGWSGVGNIASAPMFVDVLSGDYGLLAGSPCIDAANGSLAPATDIDGNPRYDDPVTDTGTGTPSYVDIGAYERQP